MQRFRLFHDGKWNEPENFLAYVTLPFKTHPTIYRLLLYVKMGARYKRKTDHVENGTLWILAYISRLFSRTAASNIALQNVIG